MKNVILSVQAVEKAPLWLSVKKRLNGNARSRSRMPLNDQAFGHRRYLLQAFVPGII